MAGAIVLNATYGPAVPREVGFVRNVTSQVKRLFKPNLGRRGIHFSMNCVFGDPCEGRLFKR